MMYINNLIAGFNSSHGKVGGLYSVIKRRQVAALIWKDHPLAGSPQGYVSVNPKNLLENQRPKVSSSFVIKLMWGEGCYWFHSRSRPYFVHIHQTSFFQ